MWSEASDDGLLQPFARSCNEKKACKHTWKSHECIVHISRLGLQRFQTITRIRRCQSPVQSMAEGSERIWL